MKFSSRKDTFFTISVLGINALMIYILIIGLFRGPLEAVEYLVLLPVGAVVGLLFWIFFGTSYYLSHEFLAYRSGPFKGEIKLEDITEIIEGKTLWVGLKPATARKGLIIKYNKYDEVYISPNSNITFIEEILRLKSDLKIAS